MKSDESKVQSSDINSKVVSSVDETQEDDEGEDMKPQPPRDGYVETSTRRGGGWNWWPFSISSNESRIWTWGR
nr:hypothetical protein [Mycoplasma haemofelis]